MNRLLTLVIYFMLTACGQAPSQSAPKADYFGRQVFGQPSMVKFEQVPSDTELSINSRRHWGWSLINTVLSPQDLIDPNSGQLLSDATGTAIKLPQWITWYEIHEFEAILVELTKLISPKEIKMGHTTDQQIDAALSNFHKNWGRSWLEHKNSQGTTNFQITKKNTKTAQDAAAHATHRQGTANFYSLKFVKHLLHNLSLLSQCKNMNCTIPPFPEHTAIIKSTWQSANKPIDVFETDVLSLKKHLSSDTWMPQKSINPLPSNAPYRISTFVSGTKKRQDRFLLGMHLSAKIKNNWEWVTLWWHPDQNSDFAADRPKDPATFAEINKTPWNQYKMCIASDYEESGHWQNPSPNSKKLNELSQSINFIKQAVSPYTLCSNPYLESFSGGFRSNCKGCHQHAAINNLSERFRNDLADQGITHATDFVWVMDSFNESFVNIIQKHVK